MAGHHRRGLHLPQRPAPVAGHRQRGHAPRPGAAWRADRLRPPLPLAPGGRGRGRGLRRQQHPGHAHPRGCADAAGHLRHSPLGVAYGLIFTASHNPPEWNGLKVFKADGSLPLDGRDPPLRRGDQLAVGRRGHQARAGPRPQGRHRRSSETSRNAYIDNIEKIVDVESIRSAGLKVIVDPMYGRRAADSRHDSLRRPMPGDLHPRAPQPALRRPLAGPGTQGPAGADHRIRDEGNYDLGMATDGDADRIAIVDESGEYISTNDLLLLVYWYLHEVRGLKGGVVRNLATTHSSIAWPAPWASSATRCRSASSTSPPRCWRTTRCWAASRRGGLTIRGHILGKDGIFACALVVEMLARTGKRISQLRALVLRITGRLYQLDDSIPSTPEMRIEVPRRLEVAPLDAIGPYKVLKITHMDGTKIFLGERQLGAAALLGHRARAAPHGRGRHPGESRRADGLAEGLRDRVSQLAIGVAGTYRPRKGSAPFLPLESGASMKYGYFDHEHDEYVVERPTCRSRGPTTSASRTCAPCCRTTPAAMRSQVRRAPPHHALPPERGAAGPAGPLRLPARRRIPGLLVALLAAGG